MRKIDYEKLARAIQYRLSLPTIAPDARREVMLLAVELSRELHVDREGFLKACGL
jgi:hypothetical protein